jgi:hypothetical protein
MLNNQQNSSLSVIDLINAAADGSGVGSAIERMGRDHDYSQADIYAILSAAYRSSWPMSINNIEYSELRRTPVISATILGNYDAIRWMFDSDDLNYFAGFLREYVDLSCVDSSGKTALDYAVDRRDDGSDTTMLFKRRIEDLLVQATGEIPFKVVLRASAAGNIRFLNRNCRAEVYSNQIKNDKAALLQLLANIATYGEAFFAFWKDAIKKVG